MVSRCSSVTGELTIVILAGVNGSGKNDNRGEMAARWKKEGKKVFLAAADTFPVPQP